MHASRLSGLRLVALTAIVMVAFAGNSLLCRMALAGTGIDAATFTGVRLASGALTLMVLVAAARGPRGLGGSWLSALALFAYAAAFSFAYLHLSAATGALLLFGAVQLTMIGYGLAHGERMRGLEVAAIGIAVAGLAGLLLPGVTAPPLGGAALMLGAGVAWGVYSLRGRGRGDGTHQTAGNFVRSVPFALAVAVLDWRGLRLDPAGIGYAVASGALASGVGYALWYRVLPALRATTAATVQLSVPAIAALGGAALLGEPITLRLALASLAILGGVAGFILARSRAQRAPVLARDSG